MNRLEILVNTLRAGRVRRWHTDDKAPQSVGEHTFGVMCVLLYLLRESGDYTPENAAEVAALFVGALCHDTAELFTGDIPAPVRSRLENVAEFAAIDAEARGKVFSAQLTSRQRRLVFYADKLEAMIFAIESKRFDAAKYNADLVITAVDGDAELSPALKNAVRGFFDEQEFL